eukprot:gene27418-31662_t
MAAAAAAAAGGGGGDPGDGEPAAKRAKVVRPHVYIRRKASAMLQEFPAFITIPAGAAAAAAAAANAANAAPPPPPAT